MMRRFVAAVVCSVALQVIVPAPAQAWWERIEEWSGPGPFTGWTVDARLVCFGRGAGPDNQLETADDTKIATGGLVLSACRLEKRRAAIDLGMGFLKAKGSPLYAGGKEISLTILEPSFSWKVIERESLDFFDYGVGAGIYWLSSEAFPSVRGSFLEPLRLDFHATTQMSGNGRWWAGIPVFRVGLLVFPAGHETAAFAPSSEAPKRISRDKVWSVGIFADLQPLLNDLINR
jgi:hypothetical protein